jgi:hypothetical protein
VEAGESLRCNCWCEKWFLEALGVLVGELYREKFKIISWNKKNSSKTSLIF